MIESYCAEVEKVKPSMIRNKQELLLMMKLLKEMKFVQAIRDYITNEESLLSFKRNDIIKIVNRNYTPQGWLRGELDGKKGLFPIEYVRSMSKTGVNSQVSSRISLIELEKNDLSHFCKWKTIVKSAYSNQLNENAQTFVSLKDERSDEANSTIIKQDGHFSMMEFAMMNFKQSIEK